MKQLAMALCVAVMTAVLVTACGGGNQQEPATEAPPAAQAPAAPAAGAGQAEITFTSQPDPPRMGENTFEVMVMQGGQPVTDADVSVMFFMPAMPSMNMAEMRNTVALKHEGAGRYRGTGNVMMAGDWDATVMAMRGGQEIASTKLRVTAK